MGVLSAKQGVQVRIWDRVVLFFFFISECRRNISQSAFWKSVGEGGEAGSRKIRIFGGESFQKRVLGVTLAGNDRSTLSKLPSNEPVFNFCD